MRIGYPCINRTIGCTANSTFRVKNFSKEIFFEKLSNNLDCLERILRFNLKHNLLFFRISSDIVPFASHPVCKIDWRAHFKERLSALGNFIRSNKMRISMHPDQFVVMNAKKRGIVKRSIAELEYHCEFLDAMRLDAKAKVQIHVGGVYGDKPAAMQRFIQNYKRLPYKIRKRLVIENDDRLYSVSDCLDISRHVHMPVIFDSFHHELLNHGESIKECLRSASSTWKKKDGVMMVDYSSQKQGARPGTHAEAIDLALFQRFLKQAKGIDFDLMLEIKNKEKSALKAAIS